MWYSFKLNLVSGQWKRPERALVKNKQANLNTNIISLNIHFILFYRKPVCVFAVLANTKDKKTELYKIEDKEKLRHLFKRPKTKRSNGDGCKESDEDKRKKVLQEPKKKTRGNKKEIS